MTCSLISVVKNQNNLSVRSLRNGYISELATHTLSGINLKHMMLSRKLHSEYGTIYIKGTNKQANTMYYW